MSETPNLVQKAATLSSALFDWAKAGFTMADTETYEQRRMHCAACPSWDASAYGGTGGCRECGCSVAKLKLATSSCPKGIWNAVHHR
jgi:hypothetical protein